MRSRLIAAAVSVATVLGLAVTGTAIAANVGTVAPEAAQSATTQASQAGTGPISGIAQGDSAQQGASSALTDRAGTGASGQTATVKASAAPRAVANDSKVKINLFDYWDNGDPNGPAKDAGKGNVNYATGGTSRNEAAAAFFFGGTGTDWNGWTKSAQTYPGIVKTNLTKTGADAVPQFSTMVTNKNDAQPDMTYLFTESEWAKAYTNGGNGLTGLFDPTEEAKGHYVYDSNTTYAALNSAGTGFDRSNTWTERTDTWIPKFLPFNADKSQLQIGPYSVSGARYAFGMTAYAKFMQPKDGKLADGSPMTFNFTGDDDLWLFVDGMLVLDIGGIHDAASGSIDFSTGAVTIVSNRTTTTTLQALFTRALKDQGKSDAEVAAWMEANMVKASDGSYTTFKNYTSHEMNMYYFERGHGGSNCKLDFNLVTLDSSQIQIGKETENVPEADKNKDYTFNAYVNYEGTDSDADYTLYTGAYDVYNDTDTQNPVQTGVTAANGTITLKAGQYAVLKGSESNPITEDTKYYVVEKDAGEYAVSANGGQVEVTKTGNDAKTGNVAVKDTPRVTVLNTVLVAPAHRKYIKKNDNNGTYTLNLDVTGVKSSGSETITSPADIVVVFDTSGSMANSMGKDTRLQVAKDAVNSMAKKLLTDANAQLSVDKQIRMSLVGFSTKVNKTLSFTAKRDAIASTVKRFNADGGTNWEAALHKANQQQGREGVKKYIVFLSDGDPTYRNSAMGASGNYSEWNPDGYNRDIGVWGAGDSDPNNRNYNAAVAEAKKRGDAELFSVGISSNPKKMKSFATDTKGTYFSGLDTAGLDAAFDAIIQQITSSMSYKNVTVSDTLSEYADFATDPKAKVVATGKDGNTVDASDHFNAPAINNDAKTMSVTSKDGYKLEDGYTYTLQFDVVPTAKAYADLAASNGKYPDTGDCGTDVDKAASAGGNCGDTTTGATSSGAEGFYSNKTATLTYTAESTHGTSTNEKTETVDYDKPVLQVELGKIPVTKVWFDGEKHADDTVTVALQKCDAAGASCTDTGKTVELRNGHWSDEFTNLADGTYKVVETNINDKSPSEAGYDVSYSMQNGNATVTDGKTTLTVTKGTVKVGDSARITVTNTPSTIEFPAANIKVRKTVTGVDSTDIDFSFMLKPKDGADGNDKVEWPDTNNKQLDLTISDPFNKANNLSITRAFGDDVLKLPAKEGSYQFVIAETDHSADNPGWKYDKDTVTVTVTVTKKADGPGYETEVSYGYADDDSDKNAAGSDEAASFTNTFVAVSALPMTGGATTRDWLVYGGGFGLLAALVRIGYFIWRKRRLA